MWKHLSNRELPLFDVLIDGAAARFIISAIAQFRYIKGVLSRRFCFTLAKTVQIVYKQSACNLKLFLQHKEGNNKVFLLGRTNCGQFLVTVSKIHKNNLKKLANCFKLQSTFILAIPS